jgi:CHAT domain-containing protein
LECERLTAALGQAEQRGVLVLKKYPPVVPAPRAEKPEGPPYADPYYWASFILIGDPN